MLAKCRVLSVKPGNKHAANAFSFAFNKREKTRYARNILGAGPSCGKKRRNV